uniref:UBIQUITIN_CONJUGAT_2 domain-containing protein n=1 Tax=Rhabditophanes sp. KR3021 TaxID=114890 RepID=A0AC35TRI7_9BILA
MAESDVLNQGAVNGSQAPRVQSYATKIDPPKEYECSIVQLDSDLLSMNNSRKTLNDSSAAKSRERLRQDFINILEIRSEIDERYQMEPDTSDIYLWNAYIVGQEGTPYAGGIFFFKINFPLDYPFEKPKIVFETRIYHPLIPHTGILKEPHSKTWSSVETPITLFKMIDYIFQNAYKYTKGHQNVSGMAWPETKREFFAKAKEFTRRNAS